MKDITLPDYLAKDILKQIYITDLHKKQVQYEFLELNIFGFNISTGEKDSFKLRMEKSNHPIRSSYSNRWYTIYLRELQNIRQNNIESIDIEFFNSINYEQATRVRNRCYSTLYNRSSNLDEFIKRVKAYIEIEKRRCVEGGIYDYLIYPKDNDIIIRREYGNTNAKTFDFINVSIRLVRQDNKKQAIEFYKNNRKELNSIAVTALTDCERFQKFNISINFLKVDNITITNSMELVYTFSLKDIKN